MEKKKTGRAILLQCAAINLMIYEKISSRCSRHFPFLFRTDLSVYYFIYWTGFFLWFCQLLQRGNEHGHMQRTPPTSIPSLTFFSTGHFTLNHILCLAVDLHTHTQANCLWWWWWEQSKNNLLLHRMHRPPNDRLLAVWFFFFCIIITGQWSVLLFLIFLRLLCCLQTIKSRIYAAEQRITTV